MSDPVAYQPQRYHTATPYIIVRDAAQLIEFLRVVFDAEVIERMQQPDGSIMHAEVQIGDSLVMLADARPDGTIFPAMIHLYLEDTDTYYRRALAVGATSLREPADQFYGDRNAGIKDRFGNEWWLATHIEDVAPEEMQRRAIALALQPG